jgi:hypothetical protein
MTRSCATFVNLDTRVRGKVRFGDDSSVEIEGRDRVEFVCKNGELQTLDVVYYIPNLITNIMSMGQLDKDGYQVQIGGEELAIREPGGRLLVKVRRSVSRLYLLTVKLSSGTCLAVRWEIEVWCSHGQLAHLNFQAMRKIVRVDLVHGCHTPFRERGNEASIRVPKMFKSHVRPTIW